MANKTGKPASFRVARISNKSIALIPFVIAWVFWGYYQCAEATKQVYRTPWSWGDLVRIDLDVVKDFTVDWQHILTLTYILPGWGKPMEFDPEYGSGRTNVVLHDMYFLEDGARGWAVGNGGTILHTSNRGKNWDALTSGTAADIYRVRFLDDAMRGWVVGKGGMVRYTEDGGTTWQEKNIGTASDLLDLQLRGDGQRLWIVTAGGTIFQTMNGGRNWEAEKTGLPAHTVALHFDDEGNHALAVANDGMVLERADDASDWKRIAQIAPASPLAAGYVDDAGQIWVADEKGVISHSQGDGKSWAVLESKPEEPRFSSIFFSRDATRGWAIDTDGNVYFRNSVQESWDLGIFGPRKVPPRQGGGNHQENVFPSVLWWLVIILCAGLGYKWRNYTEETVKVDGALDSDNPLEHIEQDRYARRRLVAGLTDLLTHGRTAAPLTVAVTGQWGVGKSSVMNMTANAMKRRGYPVFEFNAWHHDSDTQCLASLLEHLRPKAKSGLTLLERIDVRVKIAYLRYVPQNWDWFLILLAVIGMFGAIFVSMGIHPWGAMHQQLAERWLARPVSDNDFPVDRAYVQDDAKLSWISIKGRWYESSTEGRRWNLMYDMQPLPAHARCADRQIGALACVYKSDDQQNGWMVDGSGKVHSIVNGKPSNGILSEEKIFGDGMDRQASRDFRPDQRITAISLDRNLGQTVLWLGTNQGGLYRSADNGAAWLPVDLPKKEEIVSLGFLDGSAIGWLFSRSGSIYFSYDRGLHWHHTGRVATGMADFIREPNAEEELELLNAGPGKPIVGAVGILIALGAWLLAGSGPFARLQIRATTFWESLRNAFTIASTDDEAGFRHKFRKEFSLYCKACPKPPVIMIDDLDRCHPERVVMVLEVVNFLSSAGACYILLGLDWEKVKRAVGLAFEKMASEEQGAEAMGSRAARADYAANYVKKIIGLRIPVPDIPAEELI